MQHDILTFSTDMTEIKGHGNHLTSIQTQKIVKSAARIFKNGQIFSSAIVGATSPELLLEKAERPGNMGLAYGYELPKTAALQSHIPTKQSRDAKLAAFKNFFEDLCKDYPHLNISGRYAVKRNGKSFKSSYTGELESSGEFAEGYLLYKRFGSTDFAEGFLNLDGGTADFVQIRNKYEPIIQAVSLTSSLDSKKMPVLIFDYDDIIQRIIQDLKPTKFHAGGSYLSGKLGQSILSSQVTMRDLSFAPEFGMFERFDGEGVLHANPLVFDNGVFTNTLYDLREAQKAGTKSTGNGLRNFDTGINCKPHKLNFDMGKTKALDMIKDIPECLVLVASYGGSISEQWEFSNPVQVGMLFKYGKAVGRVPSVSVKGLVKDMLGKDLIGISSDIYSFTQSPAILTQLEVITH
jgi:hypothetical protein